MSVAILGLTVTCYLIGAVILGAALLHGSPLTQRPTLVLFGRILAGTGALFHAGAIGLRCIELHHAPFTTPAEVLSLLGWIVVLVYLGLEILWKLWAAGPFALGLSFLLVAAGAAFADRGERIGQDSALLMERAISLHITATVTAIAMFALAFCCAALYRVIDNILKSKNGLLWMKRLPPLKTVETAAFTLVTIGFPLLTLGILSGVARAIPGGLPDGWMTDPKTLLAYVVWIVYGIYLVARLRLKWSGVHTANILLVGLGLCLLLLGVPSAAHRFD
ncbi:MAG: c-type cytochrome biogenesis protein CcsB [Armatimonadaceae bacterium]